MAQAVYYLAEKMVRLSKEQWQPLYEFIKSKVIYTRENGQNGRSIMDAANASYNDREKWNGLFEELLQGEAHSHPMNVKERHKFNCEEHEKAKKN